MEVQGEMGNVVSEGSVFVQRHPPCVLFAYQREQRRRSSHTHGFSLCFVSVTNTCFDVFISSGFRYRFIQYLNDSGNFDRLISAR